MSRVWIYQADRPLNTEEIPAIKNIMDPFVIRWAAHNKKLEASYSVKFYRFIILEVNEDITQASGCSIDESVRAIRQIEQAIGVSFFDRSKMTYIYKGEVKSCSLNEIAGKYSNSEIANDTLVFNNIIQTKAELENNWQIPFASSGYATFAG